MSPTCPRVFHLKCCARTPKIVVPDDRNAFVCDRH
jgi:hypothetical protein